MKFEQPPLPYSPDALAPVISQETIEYHWGKHEKAYIDAVNSMKVDTEYDDMPLEQIVATSVGKLFNQASQAWNHIFYFFQFSPMGRREPQGKLLDAIKRDFGSFEDFKTQFANAGATLFGSGWVWLAADGDDKLQIIQGPNASNPMTEGLRPIMVFDVWEHAYYLDYQNKRLDYLMRLWEIVDWEIIEIRYGV